ncbi:968_t:CDS:2, partial [Dentiscutata heterogama]
YEKVPGQAQIFLARMGKNFRWPYSMPDYLRRGAFNNITKVGSKSDEEFGLEVGVNLIFFYNALDDECGQMYDDDKLNCILKTMPGAVQIPVNQKKLPRSPPARMVTVRRVNNGDDYKV